MYSNRLPLAAFGLVAAFAACESDLLTVERDYAAPTVAFELPVEASLGAVDVVQNGADLGLPEALDDFGIGVDALESVTAAQATGRLIDPLDTLTFADFIRAELWFAADGLEPVLVSALPESADGTQADFDVTAPGLQAYLLAEDLQAIFRVETSTAPGPGVDVELDVTYRVVGGV